MTHDTRRWFGAYRACLILLLYLLAAGFVASSPREILDGLIAILTCRSTLGTDYVAVGGVGAALANASLMGLAGLTLVTACKARPNGALIGCIWMITGFAFFGANVLNTAPITFGVWLYAKTQGEPLRNYTLPALLCSTLAPIASDVANSPRLGTPAAIALGVAISVAAGFLLPIIASATTRVHGGYSLYNIGFAGGIIAVFISAFRVSTGMHEPFQAVNAEGNNLFFAVILYLLMVLWMLPALIKPTRKKSIHKLKRILGHSGRLVTDYYLLYGDAAILNMGLMGILSTTVVLLLGGQLSGSILAGVFSIMGFAALGKHARSALPLMAGCIIMAFINVTPVNSTTNICAILFSTALCPIAGQFGIAWGVVAGMLHMGVVAHVGTVTGGINLYNNGFASGFVALVLVPIILALKRGKNKDEA